ncbi:MAG: hypothetical protein ACLFPW_08630 [Spirochaetaceae bacterium]
MSRLVKGRFLVRALLFLGMTPMLVAQTESSPQKVTLEEAVELAPRLSTGGRIVWDRLMRKGGRDL